jgi:hypothetical protein
MSYNRNHLLISYPNKENPEAHVTSKNRMHYGFQAQL